MMFSKDEKGFFVSPYFDFFNKVKIYYDPYNEKDRERAIEECKKLINEKSFN